MFASALCNSRRKSLRNSRAAYLGIAIFLGLGWSPDGARGDSYWYDPAGVADDGFGTSMTEVADLNNDGFDEFLIGVAGSDSSGLDAGQVFFWFGGAHVKRVPDRIWNGTSPEKFGWCVANIGDVNRDGKEDWAVGAPLSNAGGASRGRVCIFYGGANPAAVPDLVISGAAGGDQFGYAISAAGDFNGDGADDFIVGAPYSDLAGANAGAAYVIFGSGSGPSTNLANAVVLSGEVAEDHFGWSVTDAGNFLGGNEQSVAVGAPLANTYGIDAGRLYVYEGRTGGATPDATADFVAGTSAAAKPGSQFGFAVRGVGRLGTDSYDDLAVGAPYCNEAAATAGRVEFFYGGTSPAATAAQAVNGQSATDNFGWSLDRVGHVSGSTRDDVLIGAPTRDQTAANSGRAYVYEGGSTATSAASLVNLVNTPVNPGTAADDNYGKSVAYAGDFDGDGLPDYAVSAPAGNIGSTGARAGFVTLIHSSAGPVAALLQDWRAVRLADDRIALEFELGWDAAAIVSVDIVRQGRDAAAQIIREEVVWSGPARDGVANQPGVLHRIGERFVYQDDAADWGRSAARLSYALLARTIDDQTLRLDNLAGPAAPAAHFPRALQLAPVWPNPANPAVVVRFRAEDSQPVTVQVMDLRGRLVRELWHTSGTGTWQQTVWNGLDDAGQEAASGVYLVRVAAGDEQQVQRLVLAR